MQQGRLYSLSTFQTRPSSRWRGVRHKDGEAKLNSECLPKWNCIRIVAPWLYFIHTILLAGELPVPPKLIRDSGNSFSFISTSFLPNARNHTLLGALRGFTDCKAAVPMFYTTLLRDGSRKKRESLSIRRGTGDMSKWCATNILLWVTSIDLRVQVNLPIDHEKRGWSIG